MNDIALPLQQELQRPAHADIVLHKDKKRAVIDGTLSHLSRHILIGLLPINPKTAP
jgi:hypothetical protein